MEQKRKNHIKKYMIHFKEIELFSKEEILNICPIDAIYCMDTESCFKNKNIESVPCETKSKFKKYKLKQIPLKIYSNGEQVKNKKFNDEVHVYAWAISNNMNDYVIYGENIDDMFITFDTISKKRIESNKPIKSESKIKQLKKDMKFKVFVHNLAWDIEFCKYSLNRLGLQYSLSNVDKEKKMKVNKKSIPNTFQIIENDNIVYMANISLGEPINIKYTQKKKGEIINRIDQLFTQIQFLDSMKIQSIPLESIATDVIKINEMFYKMSTSYDYDKVRPHGHKLSQLEKEYLYNDVYILKEWVNQFYLPLETNQFTASAISFEAFLNNTFPTEKSKYKAFEEHYTDLSNQHKIFNIVKESYKGGWTQANRSYKGKEHNLNNALSIDINSSYPSVIKNQPLPYGQPTYYDGYHKCNSNELSILTIHFDAFKNNQEDNLIGEFQVGGLSSSEFGLNGTEYIHTNIYEDGLKGTNGKSESHRYKYSLWNFELENILQNTTLYQETKKYDSILEIYHSNGELKEGYKVESTLVFKSEIGFFGSTVDYYTEKKIEGKKTGNTPLEIFSKLVLNSFYGKLCSNTERAERYLTFENGIAKYENTDIYYETDKKYYPPFASCVTAWARVNLRSRLYEIGYDNVLYFDTDSLYTTLNHEQLVEKVGHLLHPTELGKWDIEKEYTKFKAIGSKKYILFGKSFGKNQDQNILCKCAGLPKKVRDTITFKDFYLGNTFYGKKVKTKVKGGYALIEGAYKLHDNARN